MRRRTLRVGRSSPSHAHTRVGPWERAPARAPVRGALPDRLCAAAASLMCPRTH